MLNPRKASIKEGKMKKTTFNVTLASRNEKGMKFKLIECYTKDYKTTEGNTVKLCFHHPDFESTDFPFYRKSNMWRCSEYFTGLNATPFCDTERRYQIEEKITQNLIDNIFEIMKKDYAQKIINNRIEEGVIKYTDLPQILR